MTEDELFSKVNHLMQHKHFDDTSVPKGCRGVMAFAMGVNAGCPYADFTDIMQPWTRVGQAARIMQLFNDSPAAIDLTIAMYSLDRLVLTPHQRNNLIEGFRWVMSDFTYRHFKDATMGKEDPVSRTYHLIKHIMQLSLIYNILTSGNQSVDLNSVQYTIGEASGVLIPLCNEDVDAHPAARALLRQHISEIQSRIV